MLLAIGVGQHPSLSAAGDRPMAAGLVLASGWLRLAALRSPRWPSHGQLGSRWLGTAVRPSAERRNLGHTNQMNRGSPCPSRKGDEASPPDLLIGAELLARLKGRVHLDRSVGSAPSVSQSPWARLAS
jgi:hypothetical protein